MLILLPVTPSPAVACSSPSSVNGGHLAAQSPLHVLLPSPWVSFLKMYRVLPSSPVRNLPVMAAAVAALISYSSPPAAAEPLASAEPLATALGAALEAAALGAAEADGAVVPLPLPEQAAMSSVVSTMDAVRVAGRNMSFLGT